jgi:hypothetical protein
MSTSLPQEIMITYYRPERPPSTAQDLKSCAQGDDRYQALKGRNKTVVQNQTVMPQSLAKNYLHIIFSTNTGAGNFGQRFFDLHSIFLSVFKELKMERN